MNASVLCDHLGLPWPHTRAPSSVSWHGKDACNLSTGDNLDKKCSWFYTKEKGCWKGWAQSSPCLRSCVRTSLLSDDLPSCRALPVYNRWFEHSKHKVKHFSRLSCPFLGFESSISHLCLKVVCLTSPSMPGFNLTMVSFPGFEELLRFQGHLLNSHDHLCSLQPPTESFYEMQVEIYWLERGWFWIFYVYIQIPSTLQMCPDSGMVWSHAILSWIVCHVEEALSIVTCNLLTSQLQEVPSVPALGKTGTEHSVLAWPEKQDLCHHLLYFSLGNK